MNRIQFCLSFIAGLLAMTVLGNGTAHSETFQFVICNNSGEKAAAATASVQSPGSREFVTEGWFIVSSGGCRTIGTFNTGYFYYYAESDDNPGTNWGNGSATCVRFPGPFSYTSSGGNTCSERELKGFHEKQIGTDIGTFTWTLR